MLEFDQIAMSTLVALLLHTWEAREQRQGGVAAHLASVSAASDQHRWPNVVTCYDAGRIWNDSNYL